MHPVRRIHPADLDITRWRVGEHGIPVEAAIVSATTSPTRPANVTVVGTIGEVQQGVNTPGPVSVMAMVRFVSDAVASDACAPR